MTDALADDASRRGPARSGPYASGPDVSGPDVSTRAEWRRAADHVRHTLATRPYEVADVLAELDRPVLDDDDLLEHLQRVVDLSARIISGVDSAGVTAQFHHRPFTAVHTDSLTLDIDRHQYEADDGPCLTAMRTGEIVRVDVLTGRARWPKFTADAEAAGIRSFLAAPLGRSDPRLGALNLYSHAADGFDADDEAFLMVLIDQASRVIEDYCRLDAAAALAAQLRQAMISRAPIEQAKGILMAVHRIDDNAAFDRLRTESQRTNRKLHDVAAEFVAQYSRPSP